jgi:hypothetical protein
MWKLFIYWYWYWKAVSYLYSGISTKILLILLVEIYLTILANSAFVTAVIFWFVTAVTFWINFVLYFVFFFLEILPIISTWIDVSYVQKFTSDRMSNLWGMLFYREYCFISTSKTKFYVFFCICIFIFYFGRTRNKIISGYFWRFLLRKSLKIIYRKTGYDRLLSVFRSVEDLRQHFQVQLKIELRIK